MDLATGYTFCDIVSTMDLYTYILHFVILTIYAIRKLFKMADILNGYLKFKQLLLCTQQAYADLTHAHIARYICTCKIIYIIQCSYSSLNFNIALLGSSINPARD